jgi:hypothetical protein
MGFINKILKRFRKTEFPRPGSLEYDLDYRRGWDAGQAMLSQFRDGDVTAARVELVEGDPYHQGLYDYVYNHQFEFVLESGAMVSCIGGKLELEVQA